MSNHPQSMPCYVMSPTPNVYGLAVRPVNPPAGTFSGCAIALVVFLTVLLVVVGGGVAWWLHEQPNMDRRIKCVQCWNTYVEHRNAASIHWNNYENASNDIDRRAELKRCRAEWDQVQPYEPLGVEPKMADAIAEMKRVWTALIDFKTQQVGVWIPNVFKSNQLVEAVNHATARADSAYNQAAAEIGGMTNVQTEQASTDDAGTTRPAGQ